MIIIISQFCRSLPPCEHELVVLTSWNILWTLDVVKFVWRMHWATQTSISVVSNWQVMSSLVLMVLKFIPVTPNDDYSGRTAPLTSKRCIVYIYSTNIGTEYFKHGIYSPFFFSFQNAVCFINLMCLVPVLFTFYIQGVLKLRKNNSGTKSLRTHVVAGGPACQPVCKRRTVDICYVIHRNAVFHSSRQPES